MIHCMDFVCVCANIAFFCQADDDDENDDDGWQWSKSEWSSWKGHKRWTTPGFGSQSKRKLARIRLEMLNQSR